MKVPLLHYQLAMEKPTTERSDSDALYESLEIVCDPKQAPMRIDKFLMDRLANVTRNKIQMAIKSGSVTVDGQLVKPSFKIQPANVIKVTLPRPAKHTNGVLPEDIPLNIRYEDDELIVLFKAAGMAVHPGIGNHSGTLVNALAHHLKNLQMPVLPDNLDDRPGLVHRLDKDTTGLMVVAKTEQAISHLARQFFDRSIRREYLALVWGEPENSEGTISGHIGRNPRQPTQMMVFEDEEVGKHAVTHYQVEEALYYVSLLRCRLETGRTHQIRVHLKHFGHPVFNDEKYGGNRILKGTVFSKYKRFVENCFAQLPHQALHARSLGFVHPATGEEMFFEAELPEYFEAVLERWRKYVSSRQHKS